MAGRDDRRDLRAVPAEGDHRDQSPLARDRAGGRRRTRPRLPTGHPLANIFLLKYGPQAQELQEGVAFHGRAGNALIKSLQRLHVDPLEVYGTNCVKFAGADLDAGARVAAPRAAHRRAEARRRDGRGRARVPERARVPARRGRSSRAAASFSASRPTIEALRRARHRLVARRAGREDRLLERLQGGRALVGRTAALLATRPRRRSRRLLRASRRTCGTTRRRGGTWRGSRSCSSRPSFGARPARAAAVRARAVARPGRARARRCSRSLLTIVARDVFGELRAARRGDVSSAGGSSAVFETASRGSSSSRCIIPWVDAYSVWRGPTKTIIDAPRARVHDALVRVPGSRASTRPRISASRTCSSSRSSSPRGAVRAARRPDVALPRRGARRDDRAHGLSR